MTTSTRPHQRFHPQHNCRAEPSLVKYRRNNCRRRQHVRRRFSRVLKQCPSAWHTSPWSAPQDWSFVFFYSKHQLRQWSRQRKRRKLSKVFHNEWLTSRSYRKNLLLWKYRAHVSKFKLAPVALRSTDYNSPCGCAMQWPLISPKDRLWKE